MTTELDIANGALIKLGAVPLTSLAEDSQTAYYFNLIYTSIRDDMQRSYPWKTLIKRSELAASATPPEWGYSFQCPLPADSIRVLDVRSSSSAIGQQIRTTKLDAWDLESGNILCDNEGPIYIRYLAIEVDPDNWDVMLRQVITTAVALELCESITQDPTKKAQLAAELQTRLIQAASTDSFEMQPRTLEDPSNYERIRWQAPGTGRSVRAYK